ncbi:MAG TPA: glycogen/starch synthase [Edaphocola sp.]|nr:glycogen/starch synthase [Edaphocola sp.]
MNKKRVLIITSELAPYLESSEFAELLNKLSVKTFDSGMEIRVIMPRFGTINERRHRLHEVVRLSGINVVVDKEDHPLLIKVASLPNARLQVYFMDNEDFFKRKFVYRDAEEQFYQDNTERMIFFAKSGLEIVKKFGWPPDVIHCHGWMTSLIPMFLKTAYKKEPVFSQAKTIFTAQPKQFEEKLSEDMFKMILNSVPIKDKDLEPYKNDNEGLMYGACKYADVVIHGKDELNGEILNGFKKDKSQKFVPYNEEWNEDISSLFEVYQTLTVD